MGFRDLRHRARAGIRRAAQSRCAPPLRALRAVRGSGHGGDGAAARESGRAARVAVESSIAPGGLRSMGESARRTHEELWLGLDTGGTFTDAVLLIGGERVVARAKAMTTPWDLALGLAAAIRRVLAELPACRTRADITLVSVSTTLATNAVVENRFSPVCTLLIGFDAAMMERTGLTAREGLVVRIHRRVEEI